MLAFYPPMCFTFTLSFSKNDWVNCHNGIFFSLIILWTVGWTGCSLEIHKTNQKTEPLISYSLMRKWVTHSSTSQPIRVPCEDKDDDLSESSSSPVLKEASQAPPGRGEVEEWPAPVRQFFFCVPDRKILECELREWFGCNEMCHVYTFGEERWREGLWSPSKSQLWTRCWTWTPEFQHSTF